MREPYLKRPGEYLFLVAVLLVFSSSLDAQLILERELVGAVAATSSVVSNGNTQQLKVDASFGESIIGYEAGDIIVTVGFHQPSAMSQEGNLGDLTEDEPASDKKNVVAYPNPTVEMLTVDLGTHGEKFREIRLVDVYGRIVKSQLVNDSQLVVMRQLSSLPNANYFLQGVGADGSLHQLTTIMIVTY